MKIGVIDIGSNSVRLMIGTDGKTLYKRMNTTRLSEGLAATGELSPEAMARTISAVADFIALARSEGAQKIAAFATAAVRSARNRSSFLEWTKRECGLEVDVLSGEEEAACGLAGALGGGDGGIIDVGGASTEVTVQQGGKTVFVHSFPVGTVKIWETCGRDLSAIGKFIRERIDLLDGKDFSPFTVYIIGGTASRLGAIKNGLLTYDSAAIDGTVFTVEELDSFAEKLTSLPVEEIRRTTICGKSAELVGGGTALLAAVMRAAGIRKVTVSESDNLEGYALRHMH